MLLRAVTGWFGQRLAFQVDLQAERVRLRLPSRGRTLVATRLHILDDRCKRCGARSERSLPPPGAAACQELVRSLMARDAAGSRPGGAVVPCSQANAVETASRLKRMLPNRAESGVHLPGCVGRFLCAGPEYCASAGCGIARRFGPGVSSHSRYTSIEAMLEGNFAFAMEHLFDVDSPEAALCTRICAATVIAVIAGRVD